jgi:protein transport protein SEC24
LRILTLALTTTSSYTTLYPACDLDTILNYITKIGDIQDEIIVAILSHRYCLAIRSVLVSTPKSIRDNIITQAATMLACYRKHCAQSTTAGQLILPDTMKLLPVYISSLVKCDGLIGSMFIDLVGYY